jgi:methionyl-tRNA synthetase
VTALGMGDPDGTIAPGLHAQRAKYWPAQYHVIGKEILWFHAVIWPALLMALELPLPRCIHAHSFWIADGQKMSKSMGNFVDLPTIEGYFAKYGLDAWRWYMATQGPLQASDSDFRAQHFHDTYTSELVNVVGNCPSRVTAMIGKYFDGAMPEDATRGGEWPARCAQAVTAWTRAIEELDLVAAANAPMALLRDVDAFINRTEPFKVAKDPARAGELASILAQCAEAVRIAGVLLEPFLPGKMAELDAALGTPGGASRTFAARTAWGALPPGTRLAKCALFPRVESAAKA